MPEIQLGRYRSLANEITEVTGTCVHTESNELLVLHRLPSAPDIVLATPYGFFFEIATVKGRATNRYTYLPEVVAPVLPEPEVDIETLRPALTGTKAGKKNELA